ncbi:DUF1963 domain-containing protein [Pseudaestuariivita rosea]|uniref:DUF1963 domain-containing protein n=1 Tax=Pseudaestuariivita rosea TaxID=2763263 RepID=UPI001ABA1722|nr:YwqG family protein [Pseudaestuariivita rosea]
MTQSTELGVFKAVLGDLSLLMNNPNAAVALGVSGAVFAIVMATIFKRSKPPQPANGFAERPEVAHRSGAQPTRAMPSVLTYDASGTAVSLDDVKTAAREPAPIRIHRGEDQWPEPTPEEVEAFFEENAVSGIYLLRQWPDGPMSKTSYLGGRPTLPPNISWPRNRRTGLPLHFLAQINCAELPELFDGPELPEKGTLFFFADISEQMRWKDNYGRQDDTRVLYTGEDVTDLPETEFPSDLPDIGHEEGRADGGFGEPGRKSFVKWPVEGRIVDTIPWDWSRSRDQVSPKLVEHARELANREIVALIPDAPEAPGAKELVKVIKAESRETIAGYSTDEQIDFLPDGLGGRFPYSGMAAQIVLKTFLSEAEARYESLILRRDSYSRGKNRGKVPELAYLEGYMPTTRGLINALNAIEPYEPLTANLSEAFDLWLKVEVQSGFVDAWTMVERLHIALRHIARLAISDEDLRATLPDGFMDQFRRDLQPSPNDAEHMVGGPKSFKGAPTNGEGVKLLQLDSDYALDFMFGEYGIADFWIEEEDLEALRFENAYGATSVQ